MQINVFYVLVNTNCCKYVKSGIEIAEKKCYKPYKFVVTKVKKCQKIPKIYIIRNQ